MILHLYVPDSMVLVGLLILSEKNESRTDTGLGFSLRSLSMFSDLQPAFGEETSNKYSCNKFIVLHILVADLTLPPIKIC